MKNTKSNKSVTKVQPAVTAEEILKALSEKYGASRKRKKAWLTINIKKQSQLCKELREQSQSQKEIEVSYQQLVELLSARNRFLPQWSRLDLPSVSSSSIIEDVESTFAKFASASSEATPTPTPKAQPAPKAQPKAKPTATKVEKTSELTEVMQSIAKLTESVAELAKVVSQNSNDIAKLLKDSKASAKAERLKDWTSKPKPEPKAEPKAKVQPKAVTKVKQNSTTATTSLRDLIQTTTQKAYTEGVKAGRTTAFNLPEKPKAERKDPMVATLAKLFA